MSPCRGHVTRAHDAVAPASAASGRRPEHSESARGSGAGLFVYRRETGGGNAAPPRGGGGASGTRIDAAGNIAPRRVPSHSAGGLQRKRETLSQDRHRFSFLNFCRLRMPRRGFRCLGRSGSGGVVHLSVSPCHNSCRCRHFFRSTEVPCNPKGGTGLFLHPGSIAPATFCAVAS
ncbi:unnamed protein product [Lampetra planeri]